MTRRLHMLACDRRGVAATEFAILSPVLCLFMVGSFDIAHTLYMKATLQGIVQKTARDATLEAATDDTVMGQLDERVRRQVQALANNATVTFQRRFYRTFSDAAAAKAEKWTDTNKNGTCDKGEPYTDANNNSVWDADGGNAGEGGAKDKTVYTVTVSYPHMLPLWRYVGGSDTATMTAQTVLANQPYADQGSYTNTTTVRNCPAT